MVMVVTEARSEKRRRNGNGGNRQERIHRKLSRLACKIVKEDGSNVSTQACPDGKLCNQGPVTIDLEGDTKGRANFCEGSRVTQKKKVHNYPRGMCKVVKAGETDPVFLWGCKKGVACDCGPHRLTLNDQPMEAFLCRKPRPDSNGDHPCPQQMGIVGGGRQGRRNGRRPAKGRRPGGRQGRRQNGRRPGRGGRLHREDAARPIA